MPSHNVWVSMSQAFKNELWPFVRQGTPAVTFPDINLISQQTVDFFNQIYDEGAVERLFKEWNAAGRTYKLWSFYADKPADMNTVRTDLNMLIGSYPNDFAVMGAWNYSTGAEVGNPIWYPLPSQTINFMPDIIVDDTDPDNPVYGPATELTDVNLLFGQAPRSFASYVG